MPTKEGDDSYHLPLDWGERCDATNYPKDLLQRLANGVGLKFNFRAQGSNTLDSHRVLLFAESKGLAGEFRDAIGLKYFQDGKRLADHGNLLDAAERVG